ncbi:MAG: hypothetical protein AB2992_02365 [Candidatus Symbiodolus clandestinus]
MEAWLYQHSLEKRLIDSNVLKVQSKDYLETTREIVNGEIENVNYYCSTITSQTGETVGHFSPVVHLWQGNELRATNRVTNDYLGIPADYHFLKVTQRAAGKVR